MNFYAVAVFVFHTAWMLARMQTITAPIGELLALYNDNWTNCFLNSFTAEPLLAHTSHKTLRFEYLY